MSNGLFRHQAVEFQKDRLYGDLVLLPKLSHTLILGFLLVWLVLAAFWLFSGSYARKSTVSGWVEPVGSVTKIYPRTVGTVKRILVEEGETVSEGQPLLLINGDQTLQDGKTFEEELLNQYSSQRRRLEVQLKRTVELYAYRAKDVGSRTKHLKADLALLKSQREVLGEQLSILNDRADKYRKLSSSGFVTSQQFNDIRNQLLGLRNELSSIDREINNKNNELSTLVTEESLLPLQEQSAIEDLKNKLSDIALRTSQIEVDRSHIIEATRTGIVSNLTVEEGDYLRPGTGVPLLSIVPKDAEMAVTLLVPVSAIGFVDTGLPIKMRYDAFPYQKFGLYEGKVSEISSSISLPNELTSSPVRVALPVYKVRASINQSEVLAYGGTIPLKSGMTVSADIQTDRRSLLEWIFDPVISLKGRL